ncbi:MAG: hypothetical protein HY908_34305 [Myxococcales bacterium]|nr:hypothetical protein [Myxococcales bacterium]
MHTPSRRRAVCALVLAGVALSTPALGGDPEAAPAPDCPPGAVCEAVDIGPPAEPAEPAAPELAPDPAVEGPLDAPPVVPPDDDASRLPGYEQPSFVLPPDAPARLDYAAGDPVPPGYHLSDTPNDVLLVLGCTLVTVSYLPPLLIAVTAAATENPDLAPYMVLAVPLIGPPLFSELVDASRPVRILNVTAGVTQGVGLAFMGLAFAASETTLFRDDLALDPSPLAPRVAVAPFASPTAAGLVVGGTL